jgi:hypothetical protein
VNTNDLVDSQPAAITTTNRMWGSRFEQQHAKDEGLGVDFGALMWTYDQ